MLAVILVSDFCEPEADNKSSDRYLKVVEFVCDLHCDSQQLVETTHKGETEEQSTNR